MPDLSYLFLPYQLRWIQDDARVAIGEKARRIGWTYASSFRAVDRRLRLKTDLYYTSADLTAAREFVEQCESWLPLFKAVAKAREEKDPEDGATTFVMRFKNGAKIVAGSSNPKFFRSKGGDADADEFAFHREGRELYTAMQPASAVWGHQLRVWSTHRGENSFFNQLIREQCRRNAEVRMQNAESKTAESEAAPPAPHSAFVIHHSAFSHHRVTLLDAVQQGLVEKIKRLSAPSETARRDFVEEIRSTCPDEDAWNEEYLCRPSSEQSALLTYALIQACEISDFRLPIADLKNGQPPPPEIGNGQSAIGNSRFAGYDVGRKHDRSVLWVLERVGDVLWTRRIDVLADVNYTAQEQHLAAFMQDRAVRRLCIDSTGIGHMLAERLVQRFGHRVEPVHFS
ncbi:MAG TPA: hypothetical protein VFB66_24690, partial [Tepidisphaeraceae bacterium]|nr:hypothetical protein [Tepidisphaeraceae bacterium]